MNRILFALFFSCSLSAVFAQVETDAMSVTKDVKLGVPETAKDLLIEKLNPATSVKNQSKTGTCWCFSGTSLVESQFLKTGKSPVDLSEMFTVRNIYLEKAKNYFLRQGHAQFSEGGLGHDVIRAIATYGAMPESAFNGLPVGQKSFNHEKLAADMKAMLDTAISHTLKGESDNWKRSAEKLLAVYIGTPPAEFYYNGKSYTPTTFARDYLKFNANDYVNLTSFSDIPYYNPHILSVPDNFSNGAYYNLPLSEMVDVTKEALLNGYTVLWDADVSNKGFSQQNGAAMNILGGTPEGAERMSGLKERPYTPELRQQLFDDLVTQDDHLMHIIGLEKNKAGKSFFVVKNSWGAVGPYKGYINVSEPYFAINTISLLVPKAALSKALLDKLQIK